MEIEDLVLEKQIGKGAFGEVYLTSKANTKKKFATKKIKKSLVNSEKLKKYFNNEINILKQVKHPNIIVLEDIKQTMYNFFLVFENCNGGGLSNCLEKYQKKYGRPFSEKESQHLIRQIVSGIQYLHSNNILHRDLKLDNILVNFENDADKENLRMDKATVKIIDFGFARYLEAGKLATSVLGSPINMDPRILWKMRKIDNNSSFGYDQSADIWSLGTLCYEMIIGMPPFDANSYEELVDKIKKGNYKFPQKLKLSRECIAFINAMLQFDPTKRLDIHRLANHPFVTLDASKFHNVILKNSMMQKSSIEVNANGIWQNVVMEDENSDFPVDPNDVHIDVEAKNVPRGHGIEAPQEDFMDGILKEPDDDLIPEATNATRKKEVRDTNDSSSSKSEFVIDANMEKLLGNAFDTMNKDFILVDPMLIPVIPNTDPKLLQLEV